MLRVQLLGRMVVERDGAELPAPAARRAWALLAYLALQSGPQPRGAVAARFWPDVLDSSARASLRSAVWALRRELGAVAGGVLVADRDSLGLAIEDGLWVDALAFDALVAEQRDREAVELCRGELLVDFDDDWALNAREAHRERLLEALERLASACETSGDLTGAVEWSRRQVAADAFGEEAHRRLIARLAAVGDRASALVVYRGLADRLRRELGVAPSAQTREVAAGLRAEPAAQVAVQRAPNLLPLVGRAEELERLCEAWRVAAAGSGGVVTLRGEAGIGKTRLASELLVRTAAEGAGTASCAALDLGSAAPFGLWAELIRELLPGLRSPPADAAWPDDLARLSPEIHARFERPAPARPLASPELERARLMEAVVALVEWSARGRPLVLLLEDLHIADAASLELTGYVARRVAGLPLLLVLTRRERPRRGDADRVEHALRSRGLLRAELALRPLEPARVAELARSAARLDEEDVGRVVTVAEGNALLAVEAARAIARGDQDLPDGVGAAVRGAFGTLSEAGRDFADFAAVAARELAGVEIEALPIEHVEEAAAEALDSGLFVAREHRMAFRHALLREAVYADLSEPRCARLHEHWAHILLSLERVGHVRPTAEAARHLRLAGRDAQAVEQLVIAAADARAVAALPEAASYLREALSMASDRADLLLELAEVEAWRVRREEAEALFTQACVELAAAPAPELARAWLRRARWYHGPICVPTLVRESCLEALELLDRSPADAPAERREALAALAWAEAVAGSVDEAERLLTELHRLTAGEPAEDLSTYDVGHARALTAMRRGAFEDAYAPSIAAGEAIARVGRPDLAYGCWANAAGAAAAAGDFRRALGFLDRAGAALAGKGLVAIEIQVLAQRSFVLLRVGERAGARSAADGATALAERIGDASLLAMAAHDRGLVALADGEFRLAAELLGAALVEDAPISPALTRLARAEALARSGLLDEAADEVRATVLVPLRASDWPAAMVSRLARVQGLIAAQAGDRALAVRRLEEAADGWRRQLTRLTRGEQIAAVLADLGRPVVGLIEPERELERVLRELDAVQNHDQGAANAVFS